MLVLANIRKKRLKLLVEGTARIEEVSNGFRIYLPSGGYLEYEFAPYSDRALKESQSDVKRRHKPARVSL